MNHRTNEVPAFFAFNKLGKKFSGVNREEAM